MSIRSWFERRRKDRDAATVKQAEEEAFESPEELAHRDRMGMGADNRIAGRIGERPSDLNRLGDFD
jgi:hypothetical protein